LFSGSYDFVAGIRHTATLSFNLASKTDNTFFKRNQSNMYLQAGIASTFSIPLTTTFSVVFSQNKSEYEAFYGSTDSLLINQDSSLVSTPFNYTTVNIGARYRMMDNNLELASMLSPSFGAFKRTTVQVGANYTYMVRHTFAFSAQYDLNSGIANDTIISFIYRLNF